MSPVAPDSPADAEKLAAKGSVFSPPSIVPKPKVRDGTENSVKDEQPNLLASSPKKANGPPAVPKKPIALRTVSTQGE